MKEEEKIMPYFCGQKHQQ